MGREGGWVDKVGGWSQRQVCEEEDGVKQAVRRVGGASGESVKKKTGKQAHTETDPKPGKEDEDDHDSHD